MPNHQWRRNSIQKLLIRRMVCLGFMQCLYLRRGISGERKYVRGSVLLRTVHASMQYPQWDWHPVKVLHIRGVVQLGDMHGLNLQHWLSGERQRLLTLSLHRLCVPVVHCRYRRMH